MHKHDQDLISSLAEGGLAGDALESASTEIASCARCMSDLEAHRTALAAITQAEPALLTADERVSLRATVAEELNIDLEPAPVQHAPRRAWGKLWGPVAIGAVSLVAIFALVPVAGLLSAGGGDAGDATIGLETRELTAPATTVASADPSAVIQRSAGSLADSLEAPPEVAGAATTTAAAAAQEDATSSATTVDGASTPETTTMLPQDPVSQEDLAASLGVEPGGLFWYASLSDLEPEFRVCRDQAEEALEATDPLARRVIVDEAPLEVYLRIEAGVVVRIAAFDVGECTLTLSLP